EEEKEEEEEGDSTIDKDEREKRGGKGSIHGKRRSSGTVDIGHNHNSPLNHHTGSSKRRSSGSKRRSSGSKRRSSGSSTKWILFPPKRGLTIKDLVSKPIESQQYESFASEPVRIGCSCIYGRKDIQVNVQDEYYEDIDVDDEEEKEGEGEIKNKKTTKKKKKVKRNVVKKGEGYPYPMIDSKTLSILYKSQNAPEMSQYVTKLLEFIKERPSLNIPKNLLEKVEFLPVRIEKTGLSGATKSEISGSLEISYSKTDAVADFSTLRNSINRMFELFHGYGFIPPFICIDSLHSEFVHFLEFCIMAMFCALIGGQIGGKDRTMFFVSVCALFRGCVSGKKWNNTLVCLRRWNDKTIMGRKLMYRWLVNSCPKLRKEEVMLWKGKICHRK
ncbi:hypothetical protein ADUPG1_009233, partial [Aduncisulcus paluster]